MPHTLRTTITGVRRLNNTSAGNPQYWVDTPVGSWRTMPDAADAYGIDNPENMAPNEVDLILEQRWPSRLEVVVGRVIPVPKPRAVPRTTYEIMRPVLDLMTKQPLTIRQIWTSVCQMLQPDERPSSIGSMAAQLQRLSVSGVITQQDVTSGDTGLLIRAYRLNGDAPPVVVPCTGCDAFLGSYGRFHAMNCRNRVVI